MPTSSQAMILRTGDGSERLQLRFKALSPIRCSQAMNKSNLRIHTRSPSKGNGELVHFDFSVNTPSDRSVDGFQGMFAYDQNTKTYRWQICSMLPKRPTVENDMQSGDFNIEDQFSEADTEHYENDKDFINRQPSDHTRHFPTPTASLMDNSKYVINAATELNGMTPQLSPLMIPSDTEALDETSYRRLEELGFRRRTTYTPGGALVRLKHGASPLTSPRKCSSDCQPEKRVPIISVSNLDVSNVPKPSTARKKIQGFTPNPCVTGDSMRKRVKPVKQKSLLEEVKEVVRWDKRIAPPRFIGRDRPGYMPTTICVSLREGWKYAHSDVKRLIEDQLKCQVKSLRYDPISVRCLEAGVLDRWIVSFSSIDHCEQAVQKGLAVDGDIVVVKAWDDVIRDEYLPEGDWDYPCDFRLQTKKQKHEHLLRKYLQVH